MRGTGTQAEINLSLETIDFGASPFGNATEAREVSLTNSGTATAQIDAIDGPQAPFEIIGGDCYPLPAYVAPGGDCTIEVRMSPAASSQAFAGEILVSSNSPSSPDRISLRGASPAPWAVPALGLPALVLMIALMVIIARRAASRKSPA